MAGRRWRSSCAPRQNAATGCAANDGNSPVPTFDDGPTSSTTWSRTSRSSSTGSPMAATPWPIRSASRMSRLSAMLDGGPISPARAPRSRVPAVASRPGSRRTRSLGRCPRCRSDPARRWERRPASTTRSVASASGRPKSRIASTTSPTRVDVPAAASPRLSAAHMAAGCIPFRTHIIAVHSASE